MDKYTQTTPPRLDPLRHALFLDFDGSLIDYAPTPDQIAVRPETIALLQDLSRRFGGALAIISGRRIADIDHHLAPLRLPISGVHGLEFRSRSDDTKRMPISEELEEARRRLNEAILLNDRIYIEDKGGALVLHFRVHPDQRVRAERLAEQAVADLETLKVVGGHEIFEIRQRDITKANALRRFMRRPPFQTRIPVFVGDDVTDEDGMREAAAEGGFGVKIGPEPTVAAFRLPNTEAVHGWLSRLIESEISEGTLAIEGR
jgi:trehalose 6-phosphate phosphatase